MSLETWIVPHANNDLCFWKCPVKLTSVVGKGKHLLNINNCSTHGQSRHAWAGRFLRVCTSYENISITTNTFLNPVLNPEWLVLKGSQNEQIMHSYEIFSLSAAILKVGLSLFLLGNILLHFCRTLISLKKILLVMGKYQFSGFFFYLKLGSKWHLENKHVFHRC